MLQKAGVKEFSEGGHGFHFAGGAADFFAVAQIVKNGENIVEGFAHQLDALYQADAMSVDQDIRVMETMLRRDTASAAKDFDLGGTAAQKMGE